MAMDALGAGNGAAQFSNTICVSDPHEEFAIVEESMVQQFSEFGDIARMDISLMSILKCILVTYFDVRCTQKAMLALRGRSEQFPPADHDFRIVLVSTAAFAAKVGVMGGFHQFGEVANITLHQGDALVEYYDMRAAQRLCMAAGGCASPCVPRGQAWSQVNLAATALPGMPGAGFGAPAHLANLLQQAGLPAPVGPPQVPELSPLARAALAAEVGHFSLDSQPPAQEKAPTERGGNKPVRTKISNKDFSKYDIHLEKIARGEDLRTTVMVRNLVGPRARKDFLKFLEKCGLNDRYTFFYMPCKEHRDVRAGFAFVNFKSAEDVRKLYGVVKMDAWQEFRRSDPQCKALAMSYARFQGHEELVAHFSSSVVLHELDPEKRPIFCPESRPNQADGSRDGGTGSFADAPPSPAKELPAPKVAAMAPPLHSAAFEGAMGGGVAVNAALQAALARGVQEIAAILTREREVVALHGQVGARDKSAPAYIKTTLKDNLGRDTLNGQLHPASIGG